jgi:thioredoxin-dependent peroxiredoxin
MPKLKVGDKAPDFALADQHGATVKLKGLRGRRVVVYFYPKASTSGCTTQSCALRDAEADLHELGADVVGISPDLPPAQLKFDEKHDLGFPLLSDADHAVAKSWGTWGKKSLYGREYMGIVRSAFVVDEKGKIAAAFYKVSPKNTVAYVTKALET